MKILFDDTHQTTETNSELIAEQQRVDKEESSFKVIQGHQATSTLLHNLQKLKETTSDVAPILHVSAVAVHLVSCMTHMKARANSILLHVLRSQREVMLY